MDLKKLVRISDTAQGGTLYGATQKQWINSLAQDDGGVGFGDPSTGDYPFTEESIGQMGCSCFDDGGMALNHPAEVDQWALTHDMESKAEEFVTKKLDFLKGMSSDSKKDYYCYYGGVVIYCPDEDFREDSQYEVLVPNDKIKDSTSDSLGYVSPRTLQELNDIIEERIDLQGPACDLNDIDVSNITDMKGLFKDSPFNGDISNWDVSNVTDMSYMFCNSMFNGDISNWDVSNVHKMRNLFDMSPFNGDISNWDVSNVTDMMAMFRNSQFNGDISNWDVSNVHTMACMFDSSMFNGDISNWDVSNVYDMSCMFYGSVFNGDVSNWDVSNVANMSSMFRNSQFNGDISNWDVSNVVYMSGMFMKSQFNGDISNWRPNKYLRRDSMFEGAAFNGNLPDWDVSNATDMRSVFGVSDSSSPKVRRKPTKHRTHNGPATLGECRKITKKFPFLELDDSDEYGFGLYGIENVEQHITEVNKYLKNNYPGKFCFFHIEELPEFNGIVGGLWVAITATSKCGAYYKKEAIIK